MRIKEFFIQSTKKAGEATVYTRIRRNKPNIQIKVSTLIQVDIQEWNTRKKRKKESSIVEYLQSISARPGGDADAYTVLMEMGDALDLLAEKDDFIEKVVAAQSLTEAREKKSAMEKIQDEIKSIVKEIYNKDIYEAEKRKAEEAAKLEAEAEEARRTNVILFLENLIAGMRDGSVTFKGNPYGKNTIKVWNNFLGILKRFYQLRPFTWDNIDKDLTDSFLKFMRAEGYMATAINKYVVTFRAMVGYAKKRKLHNNSDACEAFSKPQINTSQKACEIYLTSSELQALYEMPLTGLKETIRDVFLVGCYTCQRFSDYSQLERENFTTTARGNKVVQLVQTKTGNEVVVPIINDNLLAIAEKYGYNIPPVNDVVLNRYIKEILKELSQTVKSLAKKERTVLTMKERAKEERGEITFERDSRGHVIKPRYELVSSHTARRSGITNLYLTGRYDELQMMSISGHKDSKTFREYIKLSSYEIADRIAEIDARAKDKSSNVNLF